MFLAINSALLLPWLSAHRSTAVRLTAAAIADGGPEHSTGGQTHNHAFPFGPHDTEIPIIRFNHPPRLAGPACRHCVRLARFTHRGAAITFSCLILTRAVASRWVRSAHSRTSRRSSLGSFGAFLLRRSYQAAACDWVRLAQFTSLAAEIGFGRSKAREALRPSRLK